jgi:PAS domain S-box-containing protein
MPMGDPDRLVPLGEHKIGRIAQNRTPYVTNSVLGDPEMRDQRWAQREGLVAFAGHPLIVRERVVGVMALFAKHALDDEVISALSSIADHIALGIERHRSAEALCTAEERMRFALQNSDVGIWDMDYTTGVLRWSEVMEAHYGLQPGTFGGTFEAFVDRIHPDDRASLLETVGTAMKSGADFSVQNRSIWPDGTIRWLSGTGRVLLGEHGEPVRAVGISQDISERKRAEAEFTRLNDDIQLQRLGVLKATMRTVQDIVSNALMSLYMFRMDVESLASSDALLLFDQTIADTAAKLKALGDLDRVVEIQMVMGAGIDIPSSETSSDDQNTPPVGAEGSEA